LIYKESNLILEIMHYSAECYKSAVDQKFVWRIVSVENLSKIIIIDQSLAKRQLLLIMNEILVKKITKNRIS